MPAELPVIVELGLEVVVRIDGLRTRTIGKILRTRLRVERRQGVFPRRPVISAEGIEEGIVLPGHIEIGITRRTRHGAEAEAGRDEAQVLLDLELSQDGRLGIFLIAPDHLGIGVEVAARIVVTEEDVVGTEVHLIRLIIRLEQDRARIHDLGIDLATAVDGSVVIIEGAVQTDGDLGRLGHVDVDIRAQHVPAQVDVVVEVVALVDLEQTGIAVERGRDVISGHLAAAAEVGVDAVVDRLVLEQHVPPVDGRVHDRIHAEFRILDLLGRERRDGQRITGQGRFVEELHVSDRIRQLQVARRLGDGRLITDVDRGFSFTAFLGVDQDDAVRTAGAVQGGRRRVLHDGEGGDVIRLETGEVG